MSAKYTPGPWHIGIRRPSSDKFIYGPSGEEVADCDMLPNHQHENTANARLISAAPELLEVLEEMTGIALWLAREAEVRAGIPKGVISKTRRCAKQAEVIISKARGRIYM